MQGRFSTLMTFVVLALWSTAAPAHQAAEPTRPTRVEDLSLVSEREAAGHVNARVLEYQKLLLEAASIDPESPDSKKRFRDLVVEAHGHLVHAMVWAARVDRLYPEETTIGGRLLDGGFAIVGLGATGLGAAGVMFYGVLAGLNNAFNDVVGFGWSLGGLAASAFLGGQALRLSLGLAGSALGLTPSDRLTARVQKSFSKFSIKCSKLSRKKYPQAGEVEKIHLAAAATVERLWLEFRNQAPEFVPRCRQIIGALRDPAI